MRYIELIGLPGVGKTTLLNKLYRRKPRATEWTTSREVLSRPTPGAIGQRGQIRGRLLRWLGRPQGRVLAASGAQFMDANPELTRWLWSKLDLCRGEVGRPNSRPSERLDAAYDLVWALRRIGTITAMVDDRICITDEGLTHRVLTGMSFSGRITRKDLDEFVSHLPSPAAVLLFRHPDPSQLVERIRARTGTPEFLEGLHASEVGSWLESVMAWEDAVVASFRHKKVFTLSIDASTPLPVQHREVIAVAKSLFDKDIAR